MNTLRNSAVIAAAALILLGVAWIAWAAISKQTNVGYEVIPAGGAADIVISNEDLALGQIPQGGSAEGSFDMTNPGTAAVTAITITSLGDSDVAFAFSCIGGCGSLAAGETKTVSVTVEPDPTASLGNRLHPIEVSAP